MVLHLLLDPRSAPIYGAGPAKELLETMKAALAIFKTEKTSHEGPAGLSRNEGHDKMASRAGEPHDAPTRLTA